VLISGGGIAGLSLGIALKKQNIPFLILEKSTHFSQQIGGGIGLWGPALKALRQLGVEEKLHGKRLICAGYRTAEQLERGEWLVKPNFEINNRHTSCLCLRRGELQEKLLQSIDPLSIRLNAQVLSAQQTTDSVLVQLSTGEELRGSFLVAADGIDSMIRKQIFPTISPSSCGYFYWQGIGLMNSTQSESLPAYEAWHPGLRFGMVPLPDNECFWFVCSDKDLPHSSDPLNHSLSQMITPFGSEVMTLVSHTSPELIFRADLRDISMPLDQWSFDRIICIGDSIHAMAPNLAQGACLAIEDAMELANQLGTISNHSSSLTSLEASNEIIQNSFKTLAKNRRNRTRFVQTLVPLVHQMGAMKSPLATGRNVFFLLFPEWLKTIVFDWTHQLSLGWSYTPPNLHQGLYHRLLSASFLHRFPHLAAFHSHESHRHCSGSLCVTVSDSVIIRSLLSLFSLPSSNISMNDGEVVVDMICDPLTGAEIWNRTFRDRRSQREYSFVTKQDVYQEELKETFLDFFVFYLEILESDHNFLISLTDFSLQLPFFGPRFLIPLPSLCQPTVVGNTIPFPEKDGWEYEVEIGVPKWCQFLFRKDGGRILRYKGSINCVK
jgi:2-polyprenyl-6-methoxyphenol hydroxylase-like FAD-dependent oxidoreductase